MKPSHFQHLRQRDAPFLLLVVLNPNGSGVTVASHRGLTKLLWVLVPCSPVELHLCAGVVEGILTPSRRCQEFYTVRLIKVGLLKAGLQQLFIVNEA